jgi:hypothetical protein
MPKGGWTQGQIDVLMSERKMQAFKDGVWANRDNPQLLNNTALAQHSGMGPRFGAIVSKLNDPEELDLFLRSGMGDMRAVEELSNRNAAVGLRMRSDTTRLAALDLMRTRYANMPGTKALVDAEMNRITTSLNADADLVSRYESIIGTYDETGALVQPGAVDLLDQLHVSRWSIQRAEDRTIAQNQYNAGPARGGTSAAVRGQGRAVTLRPSRPLLTKASYTPTPIDTGYVHTRLWGAGDYFTGPVTMVRSLKNMHPNGYMRLDVLDKDSMAELRGHLARIPNMKESTRQAIINNYLKTNTEAERLDLLEDVGRIGAAKVAQRYGLSPEDGVAIYEKYRGLKQGEIDNMKRYTAAMDPERMSAAGQPLHLDELTDTAGKTHITPFTATRLVNGHVFQDLDQMGRALARHGDKLKTLRAATGSTRDALEQWADYANYLWKFSTLFRLGYIPRVLGDDLASQWARAGTAAMALRTARGVKNAFHNASLWATRPALEAREANARNGVEYAASEMALLAPDIRKWEGRIAAETQMRQRDVALSQQRLARAEARLNSLSADATPAQRAAAETFVQGKRSEVQRAAQRASEEVFPGRAAKLQADKDRTAFLQRYHDLQTRAADDYLAQQQKVIQGNQAVEIDGHTFPAAFGGKAGEYWRKLVSADETVGNLFATNKQLMQGNLERSFDHGAKPISALQDPEKHAEAWAHAINNQIMQDQLSRMAVRGATVDEMTAWLKTNPQGIAYRRRLPKMMPEEEFARSAKYEVDQYLHTPEIRMKAQEETGVTPEWLQKATPHIADRPDVHIGQVGQSQLTHASALDRVIQRWFKVAATMPANRMSRHPLFNSFYEGHLKRITASRKTQGVTNLSVGDINQITSSARQLALRDTRELVFDIAHRSDAASAMRFISPFFSATAESFQRWGRVIADKPQIVGYAGNWYNAPAYLGAMQDSSGNRVDANGYAYVPVYPLGKDGMPDYSKKPTVQKTKVPKSDRYIVTRVPKWVAKSPLGPAFNITEADGKLMLSQNSINVVTQGDPVFSPGVGPIVQIPVNEFVRDKPKTAELARELGVLPYGVQGGTLFGDNAIGRAVSVASPAQVRNAITAFDTSDQRYQAVKLQIMQREIFEFERRTGREPTRTEMGKMQQSIANKTRNYWIFSAASSFLQPMATVRKDPYQFYRDQYMGLRRQNPLTADDQFLQRYGESYFIFAQEQSDSSGIPPTKRAVELSKKYASLIAANPEMAALIVGPEGNGPFSLESYQYQLNNPLVPGGAEMQRTKISADEAMKENQRRLGWAKYTQRMNALGARLRAAGFTSYDQEGAEQFASEKKAWTSLYAEPLMPDGSANPYYNEEWSKDFFTQDQRKYERMIPALTEISRSELARDPKRTDLRKLQEYLGGRLALVQELQARKAAGEPSTLQAQANSDLRSQWLYFVDQLVESDTRFGDLYHRYLSRDMGVDVEQETEE